MNPFDSLLTALVGAPSLPGAKCRGRSHLFDEAPRDEDPEDTEYRHDHALRLCRGCPSLDPCREWLDGLPLRQKPSGVVAGRPAVARR